MNNKAELLSKIKKLAEAGFYGEQTNACLLYTSDAADE